MICQLKWACSTSKLMILIVDNNDDNDGNGDAVVGDIVELEDGY